MKVGTKILLGAEFSFKVNHLKGNGNFDSLRATANVPNYPRKIFALDISHNSVFCLDTFVDAVSKSIMRN